jgi:hypothetical protein
MLDLLHIAATSHLDELLREAETERLAALVPSDERDWRASLAQTLHAVANWLEETPGARTATRPVPSR